MTTPSAPPSEPAREPTVVPEPGPEVRAALSALTLDPDTQAAIWRVWYFGTGLLERGISRSITAAYVEDDRIAREGQS